MSVRRFILLLQLAFVPLLAVARPFDNSQDIAVIDRALTEAKPGARWIDFGDVGMSREQLEIFRERLLAQQKGAEPNADTPPNTTFKWPGGNVYYRFDPTQVSNGTITAGKMQAVRDAVAEWAAFAKLTFVENISGQPHYVTYVEDSSLAGGFSTSVGMDPNNAEQFIRIGPNAWNRGTLCHETGHALGLWHEQQRDDRDTYVTINFSNIDPGNQGNFTKLPGGTTAIGPYDFYSVMHYSRAALTNKTGTPNPNAPDPTIDTTDPTAPYVFFLNIIGNVYDRTLSKLDRAGMASIYGNPAALPSATVTNTKDSGPGTLRTALYYAFDRSTDAVPTPTAVIFNIPTSDANYGGPTNQKVFTIRPTYLLVAPGAGTTIDGATQTAFTGDTNTSGPEILLDGSQVAAQNLSLFASGLLLRELNCTVRNLVINGFNRQGIVFDQPTAVRNGTTATGNVISGCYIGTDATGTTAVPNGSGFPGIELFSGAHGNTIGGTTAATRNVISGNLGHGIVLQGAGTNSNVVVGNYIGTNAAGTGALPNLYTGVAVFGGAQNNTVGGTSAGARNVLSGNKRQGFIFVDAGTSGNVALGNYVGLNAAGAAAIPNGNENMSTHSFYPGAAIFNGAQNNTIGGAAAGSANVISGNTAQGIILADTGTSGNLVQGNFIGTDPTGVSSLGNGFADVPNNYRYAGISIFGSAATNTISSNVLSGNAAQGINISGSGTNANSVLGNFIGTNAAGSAALANSYEGVAIFSGAQSNLIGGSTVAARNIISGNSSAGISVSGSSTNSNLVRGNYIGVNFSGTSALANGAEGISVFGGAQSNIFGGNTPGTGNVISGNGARGIGFFDAATAGNSVQGNLIGLNAAGTAAIANAYSGVECYLASNNTIGGANPGARNYISGNGDRGVLIDGPATTGNVVVGNTIGLTRSGSVVANSTQGIALFNGATANTIGGSATGASNLIASNTQEGIALYDSTTNANTFSRNSIFSNHVRGIGIYSSSNNSQPAPSLNTAILSTPGNPGGTDVSVSLGAAATVEFFASPSGNDEGQFFIDSRNLSAGTSNVSLGAAVPASYVITATATASGNTSQFSSPITVTTTDTDGDGIPDAYAAAHGLAGNSASQDADGDGRTNLQEFRAGTDPKSAASLFRVATVTQSGNDLALSFNSFAGKTYRVETKDDLSLASWTLAEDQILATSGSTAITDFGAASLTKRFYRIVLEP